MTAIEKAKELVEKFLRMEDKSTFYWNAYFDTRSTDDEVLPHAKQCALICVDEIQKLPNIEYSNANDVAQYDYWQSVKQEINNL